MDHPLTTIGLGPVLLAQGHYVRRVTPRLPEPPGDRHGTAGAGAPLRLLLVGDSAAAGVGADSQAAGLSGRLVAALAGHFTVSWRLVARAGSTTPQLLELLAGQAAETFDVAVISTGVNDLTGGTASHLWIEAQARVVEFLRERFGIRHALLAGLPPMQRFPALPHPLAWYLGRKAALYNRRLDEWARGHAYCEFALPVYPLDPALAAADGFHPGPRAYALWADQLAQRIVPRWRTESRGATPK